MELTLAPALALALALALASSEESDDQSWMNFGSFENIFPFRGFAYSIMQCSAADECLSVPVPTCHQGASKHVACEADIGLIRILIPRFVRYCTPYLAFLRRSTLVVNRRILLDFN